MALFGKPDEALAGPGVKRGLVLAAAMMAMFTAAVEATIVATAMPTIIADLGGLRLLSWVFAAYLLAQTVTIPIYGRLADMYGRKPVFFAGMSLFLVSSVLCGFAWGMVPLIVFRALQGLGAGAIAPIATTIVGDIYTPEERARKQGYLSSVWGVSALVGPLLGAFLVENLSWSLVFWINLPIGGAAILMLALFLTESPQERRHQIDYMGALLLSLCAGLVMFATSEMRNLSWVAVTAILLMAVIAFLAFIRHERDVPEPVMPLELWRDRIIAVGNAGGFMLGAILISVVAFLPPYVQGVMGRSVAIAGFVVAVVSIGWPLASIIAGRLMVRTSYRLTAILGGLALMSGSAVLVTLDPPRGPLWAACGAFIVGVGLGLCNTTFVVSIQASVDWSRRGVATSSNIFSRMMGQSLGAAIFGGILNYGLYRQVSVPDRTFDRLMDPSLRESLDVAEVGRLIDAVAAGLHNVFVAAGFVALVAFVLTMLLPVGLNPARHRS